MDHKELDAWKVAVDLSVEIYSLTQSFPKEENFGLVQQIRRSTISIPSNIAEGCARGSSKETINFLYVSLGSLAELETQIIIASKLGFVNGIDELLKKLNKLKQVILGLIRYLKTV
ncbi:four helix bundle protein [Tenuifilum osseticum]|uniref:four helix bundle protein n=1 Tax=Tenuifilum osseticum TaxID=3374723 RepID=UPI0034E542C4